MHRGRVQAASRVEKRGPWATRRFLESWAGVAKGGDASAYPYASQAGYILKHGRAFEWRALPHGVRLGLPRQRFRNAVRLALRKPRTYTYVEGYAINTWVSGHPVQSWQKRDLISLSDFGELGRGHRRKYSEWDLMTLYTMKLVLPYAGQERREPGGRRLQPDPGRRLLEQETAPRVPGGVLGPEPAPSPGGLCGCQRPTASIQRAFQRKPGAAIRSLIRMVQDFALTADGSAAAKRQQLALGWLADIMDVTIESLSTDEFWEIHEALPYGSVAMGDLGLASCPLHNDCSINPVLTRTVGLLDRRR